MADATLKLYGFPTSNFYNKVKLALLEKAIPYEDVKIGPSQAEEFLRMSPMGKIPFIESNGRFIFESSVIFEFLETVYPQPPLLPTDPYEAALTREIIALVDLHLDAPARRLFSATRHGGQASPELLADVRKKLDRGVAVLTRVAKFAHIIAGSNYTYADAAAIATLPLLATLAQDFYADVATLFTSIPGYVDYMARMAERPATVKVNRAIKALERARAIAEKQNK